MMTYTGEALGVHSLPVQLHILHGRRLRLDLVGVCAPPTAQTAQLPGASAPGADGQLQLRPVRVASSKPPLQMFRIQNAGPATMHWRLDLAPVEALKEKYFGYGRICAACCGCSCMSLASALLCCGAA